MMFYRFNAKKAIEVILWVANQNKGKVSFHAFFKAVFYADLFHINKYGRPVLGDNYIAMDYGPVLSRTYNILKKEGVEVEALQDLPFEIKHNRVICPKKQPNLEYLSESDVEALKAGWDYVKDKTFDQLVTVTHAHSAYINARKKDAACNNPPMSYDDFLDPEAKEKYRDFFELSHLIKI